uniref:Ring canal kelch-like protein n=1 Tax=Triatoma infestans TaxID=30076 RepID=A0A170V9A9_TRIIF
MYRFCCRRRICYELSDVRDACCDFLQSQLHPTNCLGIRAFADLHGCIELLANAETFIEQHFSEVVECEEFLALSHLQVCKLICSGQTCCKIRGEGI